MIAHSPGCVGLVLFLKKCLVFECYSRQDQNVTWKWRWKKMIQTGIEKEERDKLYQLIAQVRISDIKDSWLWLGDKNGIFSVKSVKRILNQKHDMGNTECNYRIKWLPNKCNIFRWRAELDRLPTFSALEKRNVAVQSTVCTFCEEIGESTEHIFTGCIFATNLWLHLCTWWKKPMLYAFSVKDLFELHRTEWKDEKYKEVMQGLIVIGCCALWRARNEAVFENKEAKMEKIVGEVKSLGFLWYKNRAKMCSLKWENWEKFSIM